MTLVDAAIFAQRFGRMGGQGHPHWLGIIFMVLLVVLVVAAIVALIMWMSRTRHAGHPGTAPATLPAPTVGAVVGTSPAADARRILDERLARGEIEPDEYRSRREALDS
jgi:putative membrane protein